MLDFLNRLDERLNEAVQMPPSPKDVVKTQLGTAKVAARVEREKLKELRAKNRQRNNDERHNLGVDDTPEVTVKLESKILSRISEALDTI